MFDEFADLEQAITRAGIPDADNKELWQIACALGVHRPTDVAARTARASGFDEVDDALAELIHNQMVYEQTGQRPEWGPETAAERAANERGMRSV